MKISLLLLDLILFFCIFIPYYLFIRVGKRTKKKKIKIFKGIAKSHGLSPDFQEHWGNRYVAIDSQKNSLLFIHMEDQEAISKIISIDKVKECKVINSYQRKQKGKNKEEVLVFLAVELEFLGPGQPTEVLPFYEAGESLEQNFELARGQKWLRIIKGHLKPINSGEVAA